MKLVIESSVVVRTQIQKAFLSLSDPNFLQVSNPKLVEIRTRGSTFEGTLLFKRAERKFSGSVVKNTQLNKIVYSISIQTNQDTFALSLEFQLSEHKNGVLIQLTEKYEKELPFFIWLLLTGISKFAQPVGKSLLGRCQEKLEE